VRREYFYSTARYDRYVLDADRSLYRAPKRGVRPRSTAIGSGDADFVILLFHRDFHCGNCQTQASAVADRYEEFQQHGAVVVSVLPESKRRATEWAAEYELPFPVVADPDSTTADRFGQPVRLASSASCMI